MCPCLTCTLVIQEDDNYLYLVNETATHKFLTFYLELFTGENLVYVKIQIIVNVLIYLMLAQ